MSNYKYNKYKNKYMNYKNQSGGATRKTDIQSIESYLETLPLFYLSLSPPDQAILPDSTALQKKK